MDNKLNKIISVINQSLKDVAINLIDQSTSVDLILNNRSNTDIGSVLESFSSFDEASSFFNGLIWMNNGEIHEAAKEIENIIQTMNITY